MNFLLKEMTFLRYFAPIALEASRRGKDCHFFVDRSNKYNCPFIHRNAEQLKNFCERNKFNIHSINEISSYPGLTFLVEGVMREALSVKHHSVSLTYMTDFRISYKNYIDDVDHVIFPSERFASFYNTLSEKNLYLGSPKYDFQIEKQDVYDYYRLNSDDKHCLIVYPKQRDRSKVNVDMVLDAVQKSGYVPIIKFRGKDRPRKSYDCMMFGDERWNPHTTLELLTVCDFVVNTGSTTIKEAVMKNVPILNFDVKSHHKHLSFLYEYDFCVDRKSYSAHDIESSVLHLTTSDFDDAFHECKKTNLFVGNSTERILGYFDD